MAQAKRTTKSTDESSGFSAEERAAMQARAKEAKAEVKPETRESKPAVEKTAHVKALEDELRQKFAVRVEIKMKAKEKGQIVLAYESNDDFERIVEALKK